MAKVRVRNLWVRVAFKGREDLSWEEVIDVMIRSIERGDYRLPRGLQAVIFWKNHYNADWRRGEWRAELEASATGPAGSQGFEKAIIAYLEKQR